MDELNYQHAEASEELNLLDFLIILAKYSRMIIYTTLILSILTLGYLLTKPNQYTATATVMPPQQNMTLSSQILDTLGVAGNSAASTGSMGIASLLGLKSPGDLYVGMLKGITISDRVIDRFNLREVYRQEILDEARRQLAGRSDIKTGKDGLISIGITDEDPKFAADMANAFVEELDRLLQEISVRDASNQLAFLDNERNQANLRLSKAEEALRTFSETKSVIQIDAQAKGMLEYIAQLRAAIDAKEVQLQVARKYATPSNYDLIRLETELKGLREKLRAAEGQATDQDCIGDVCIAPGKVPSLGLEYFRLYREVKFQETVYQLFTKMAEIARIDAARNTVVNTIQVVDRAVPPQRKSKPHRAILTIIAGIVFGFLMIFVAFTREYYENAKKSPADSIRLQQLAIHLEPWTQKLFKLLRILHLKKK